MTLSRNNWVAIGIAVLTLAVHGGYIVWRQADVRYGTGGAYISSKCGAISTLGLKNWGGTDADEITLAAVFADPLTDIAAGPMGTRFHVADGGIGHKQVIGTVNKLRPTDEAYIYFFTEPTSLRFEPGQFIQSVKFNGGLGRTGTPILKGVGLGVFFAVVFWGAAHYGIGRRLNRYWSAAYRNYLCKAIQMGQAAAQAGTVEAHLQAEVEAHYGTIRWFERRPPKDTMVACALCAFRAAKGLS